MRVPASVVCTAVRSQNGSLVLVLSADCQVVLYARFWEALADVE